MLPLLATDLFSIMLAVRDERLSDIDVKFMDGASCCVVLASGGYPGKYLTGYEIHLGEAENVPGVEIFHAGTRKEGGKFFTAGGRVLAVTAVGETPSQARERAYDAAKCISFEGMRYRSDIGAQ